MQNLAVKVVRKIKGIDSLWQEAQRARCLLIVRHHYPGLAGAERKIAQFIMDNPNAVSTMSSQELAEVTETSEATVFRFCKSIGYTFSQLKYELRHLPLNAGLYLPRLQSPGSIAALFEEAVLVMAQMLVTIDNDRLQQAIGAIRDAQRIDVCGMGSVSGLIAELTAFKLNTVDKISLSWVDQRIHGLLLHKPGEKDVVLGISHSGNNLDVARTLAELGNAGATTIAITNYPLSPVAEAAHIPLVTGMAEQDEPHILGFIPRLAPLALIEFISEQMKGGGV